MSSVSACHSFQILCIRLWKKRGWTHARRIPVNTFICRFIFSYRRENKFCTLRIKNNVDCYINFQLTSLAYGELCRLFLVCSCSGGLAYSLCFITDTMRTQRHPPPPTPVILEQNQKIVESHDARPVSISVSYICLCFYLTNATRLLLGGPGQFSSLLSSPEQGCR